MFVRRYKKSGKRKNRRYKKLAKSGQSSRKETFFFTFDLETLNAETSHHEEMRLLDHMGKAKPWQAMRALYDQFKINFVKVKATWANCSASVETYPDMILAQMAIDPTRSSLDAKSVVAADYENFHQQKWNKANPSLNQPVVAFSSPKTLSGKSIYRSTEEFAIT